MAEPTFCVYMHHDRDGAVLYVGMASDLQKRTADHRRGAVWWGRVARVEAVAKGLTKAEAAALETQLIGKHDPPGNYVGTPAWSADLSDRQVDGGARPRARAKAKPLARARPTASQRDREGYAEYLATASIPMTYRAWIEDRNKAARWA